MSDPRNYGFLVRRLIGDRDEVTRRFRSKLRIQPIARKISDPFKDVEIGAEQLDRFAGVRPPTPWMQRLANRAKAPVQARQSGVTVYDGRACCYEHLRAFEGRPKMKFPFRTSCPNCGTEFEIALSAVRVP
jgi:hypothetical protein